MSVADAPSTQSEFKAPVSSGLKKWGGSGLLLFAVVLLIGYVWWPADRVALPPSLSLAAYEEARLDYIDLFHREPSEADLMMMIAETAVRNEQPDVAVDCFERIPSEHIRYGASARLQEAQVLMGSNCAERAEASFRAFLSLAEKQPALSPEHVKLAREWLVFIMAVELRMEDRKEILQAMIRDGQFDVYDAKQYYFPTLLIWQSTLGSSRLRDFLQQAPDSRVLRVAQARYLVAEGKLDEASDLLASLRQQHPGDAVVIAASLECFYEQVDWEQFKSTLSATPAFQDGEPWLLTQMRAEYALQTQDWPNAEKYFLEVLKRDRANPTCHMGLAKAFNGQGKVAERRLIQERSRILARIRVGLSAASHESAEAARSLAQDARDLGMSDAAETFEFLAKRIESGTR